MRVKNTILNLKGLGKLCLPSAPPLLPLFRGGGFRFRYGRAGVGRGRAGDPVYCAGSTGWPFRRRDDPPPPSTSASTSAPAPGPVANSALFSNSSTWLRSTGRVRWTPRVAPAPAGSRPAAGRTGTVRPGGPWTAARRPRATRAGAPTRRPCRPCRAARVHPSPAQTGRRLSAQGRPAAAPAPPPARPSRDRQGPPMRSTTARPPRTDADPEMRPPGRLWRGASGRTDSREGVGAEIREGD